jgi:hypothetical protein
MKESMLKRIPLILLLVIQALGGAAVTLAHARDVVAAPPGVEASHDARCAILHDEMRCALCHYASARVVTPQTFTIATPAETIRFTPTEPVVRIAAVTRLTPPARAPPSTPDA